MSNKHNSSCPVCSHPFRPDDDVVVCPECGASYHRSCYQSVGECLYRDKHGTDFSFVEMDKPQHSEQYVLCPNCQKSNPADAPACENCGTRLEGLEVFGQEDKEETPKENTNFQTEADSADTVPAYRRKRPEVSPDTGKFRPVDDAHLRLDEVEGTPEEPTPMSELKKQLNLSEQLDGFSLKEWLCFIGPAGPLYLFQFKKMDASKRGLSFSLPAAFFPGIFFLYRKVWGWGILATLIKLVCVIPSLLGFAAANGASLSLPYSAEQLSLFAQYATYLDTAMSIFWGIAAATLYRKHSITRMRRLKQSFCQLHEATLPLQDEFHLFLAQKGGVCLPAGLAAGVISVLIYYAVAFFL